MANLSRSKREKMGLSGHKKIEREFEKKMVVDKTIEAIFKN